MRARLTGCLLRLEASPLIRHVYGGIDQPPEGIPANTVQPRGELRLLREFELLSQRLIRGLGEDRPIGEEDRGDDPFTVV